MNLSIVISLYNEAPSLKELLGEIRSVAHTMGIEYEIILVDDGSTDGSWDIIEREAASDNHITAICFRRNYGKSAALYCGFAKAEGDVVITMDADLQDNPEEIPDMYDMITKEGYDLVSGWKKKRYDNPFTKNIPSHIYNATARFVTGVKLHDMNCGLKAYKKDVVKNIEVYGEMHRYIPYLAKEAGFTKIAEKVVKHRKRKFGKSKFGISRFINGYLDLLSLWFLEKFGKKPMHFFGFIGSMTFLAGFAIAIILIVQKLYRQTHFLKFRAVTDQPLFYIALCCLIIGTMLFLTGFISELVSRNSSERNRYNIKKTIGKS
ncbi:MAG: glycosyltransferase family 2 protein [Bacteroidales bacterium]|jgi:glycosyltransferase involved in cell wall biosynthesis|nr:glycosyltransferase family 2 protein [Bacteroidales bacterium]